MNGLSSFFQYMMHVSMSAESAVLLLMDKKVGKNFEKKKKFKKIEKKILYTKTFKTFTL